MKKRGVAHFITALSTCAVFASLPVSAQSNACSIDVELKYTSAVEQVVNFKGLVPGRTVFHPEEPKRGDRAQCVILQQCLVQAELYSAVVGGVASSGDASATQSQVSMADKVSGGEYTGVLCKVIERSP